MPPTPRVVGIDLAKHLVHHAVPVAIEMAGHALGGSHATCAQEFNLTTPIAKIVPLAQPLAAVPTPLAALAQAGLVTRGSGQVPDEVWTLPRPKDPEGRGRRALTEERETDR